jgi:hypothetical protein
MIDHPTDPRELRKLIRQAAYRGEPLTKTGRDIPGVASTLARNVLHMGEFNGLSGEDTMTVLAYHLMVQCETLYDSLLRQCETSLNSPVFIVKENPTS